METQRPSMEHLRQQEQERAKLIQDTSDVIRKNLSVEEMQEWQRVLQTFNEPLVELQEQDPRRELVEREYENLIRAKMDVQQILHAFSVRTPTPLQRDATLRALAKFLRQQHRYTQLARGDAEREYALPSFLARHADLTLQDEMVIRGGEIMLPFQFDVQEKSGLSKAPPELAAGTSELLMLCVKRGLDFAAVETCFDQNGIPLSSPQGYEALLRACGYTEWNTEDVEAAKLLAGFFGKYRRLIRERRAQVLAEEEGRARRDISITEALECCLGASLIGEMFAHARQQAEEVWSGHIPTLAERMGELLQEKEKFFPDHLIAIALRPLGTLRQDASKEDREQFRRDARDVGAFLLGSEAKRLSLAQATPERLGNLTGNQQPYVTELRKLVMGEAYADTLMRNILLPGDAGYVMGAMSALQIQYAPEELRTQTRDILLPLLRNGDITLREAFELHYLQSVSEGNSLLLTYKVLQLLKDHGHAELSTELQSRLLRQTIDLAVKAAATGGLDAALADLPLSPEQRAELGNMAKYFRYHGLNILGSVMRNTVNHLSRYPEYYGPAAAATIVSVGLQGAKFMMIRKIARLGYMSDAGLMRLHEVHGVPLRQLQTAREEAKNIYDEIHKMWFLMFRVMRGRKLRLQGNVIANTATMGNTDDMVRSFREATFYGRRLYPDPVDFIHYLYEQAPDAHVLRESLLRHGYAEAAVDRSFHFLRGILEPGEWHAFMRSCPDVEVRLLVARRTVIEQMPHRTPAEVARVHAARSAFISNDVEPFMARLNEISKEHPEMRGKAVRSILGTEADDAFVRLVEQAHAETNLRRKVEVLLGEDFRGLDPLQRAKRLERMEAVVRTGLAGRADSALLDEVITEARHTEQIVDAADALPRAAEEMIRSHAEDAADAAKVRRGFHALKRLASAGAAGIDGLFLVYEGWQLVQLSRDIEELEKAGGKDALLALAAEKQKEMFWHHGTAFALDAGATLMGSSTFFLSQGSRVLAIVSSPAGVVGLIAVPAGGSMAAGMRENIMKNDLHLQISLADRVRPYDDDVRALGQSRDEQLYELGDPSMTQAIGAALTSRTLADMERFNASEREEIVLAGVLRQLKDLRPAQYQRLLEAVLSFKGVPRKGERDVNLIAQHPFGKNILAYLRVAFVDAARTSSAGSLSAKDVERLRAFDIDKDWLRRRLTEEDIRRVVYDAAQILEASLDAPATLATPENARAAVERMHAEKLRAAGEQVRWAFGKHAERLLRMEMKDLDALRQRHANILVDIHYYLHSSLRGVARDRNRYEHMFRFAQDNDKDIPLLRLRLDALNEFLQVKFHIEKLVLQPFHSPSQEEVVSAPDAFLLAGRYRVAEGLVAPREQQTAVSGPIYPPPPAPRSVEELHAASERSPWIMDARRRYRTLLDEFEA